MSDPVTPYLLRLEARPHARVRLVCFPHAGGGASSFATWHRALPRDIELFTLQLPGREARRREPPILDMAQLMRVLAEQLHGLHDRPVALFGHSLGALTAFEYARVMRRVGHGAPLHLFVSAASAPQRPRSTAISHLTQSEFIDEIVRRYDGIPKMVLEDAELRDYFIPVLRTDLRLLESYTYVEDRPLECPVGAFGGLDDPRVTQPELDRWSVQTTASFSSQMYPGGHFFVTSARDALLATITAALGSSAAPEA